MSTAEEGGPVVMDDWQPMSSAPNNATEVRVRTADGTVIERAHWACDLSGEEQPAFCGWFRPVTGSDGRVLHYVDIGEPVGWMAVSAPKVTEEKLSMEAIGALGETDVDNFPSPAAGQRYACADEEGFTLSRLEPGRTDTRYWITTDGRTVDMYAVSPRTGWSVELIATPESEGGLTGAASDVDPLLPADHPLATRPRREDAVGLVREPFKPSARAAAETLEVLARAGDADELARLLPGLAADLATMPAIVRITRAAELLTRERERVHDILRPHHAPTRDGGDMLATLARIVAERSSLRDARSDGLRNVNARNIELTDALGAAEEERDALRARVAELEAMLTAPPVGSVAWLLAKVDEARSVASSKGANHAGESAMAYRYEGMRDAFDIARDLIRSALAAPTDPMGKVAAEVLAVDVADVIPSTVETIGDHAMVVADFAREVMNDRAGARGAFVKAARVCIAAALACDAAKGGSHV